MLNTKQNFFAKFFVLPLMIVLGFSLFLFIGCEQGFDSATKININQPNTSEQNMKYTAISIKDSTKEVYVTWTIAKDAKDGANYYSLIILDKDKHALTTENNLTAVTIYDKDQKSLGTATTETHGVYNLSEVLADNKIAGGTYYAVLKFSAEGTYNLNIQLNE